jgi:hypothetical protein
MIFSTLQKLYILDSETFFYKDNVKTKRQAAQGRKSLTANSRKLDGCLVIAFINFKI